MPKLSHLSAVIFAASLPLQSATAQLGASPIPSALPGVSSISLGNAAGVLNYCMQNNLVSSTGADAVLSTLPSKPDVKSADYSAGAGGKIMGDHGKNFTIAGAPKYLQSQACDMVLQQAKAFK
jgi:hypothetical protein